ncbi:N-acetylglucosaminyldiphosphoundecaprenol N-acetyl-beta-D-mannosaminyltransferase [Scopulibacillus darangshiensis]|uniref:N-acetylglucosaminyldiphosphoundecaprenol N-acetyl-beta-D-mannosaminyltransferase n=2 Tax=Scopulibacillus darangshiensis TaxID=442528 RepID=A0A4R2NWK7_9BACL|nr:N-acetylglucosaminyldiphosphoundecaprenol N-acetyl-beta-D-mannosaminyltransferase [Scopulibacillus darangshiensis]
MGIHFINATMDELQMVLEDRIDRGEKSFVVTANPEILMYSEKDQEYRGILESATMVTPDGAGIILAGKILGKPLKERLAGYDLFLRLLTASAKKGYKVYFLGAQRDVLETAIANAKNEYPGLNVAGYHDGYFQDDSSIVNDLKKLKPDIVFVGLGFPKQEKWINLHLSEMEKGLFIGLGGSFDGLAGKMKRAPEVWQKMNIEWLHRLIQQPSRWRRMLALPVFVGKIFKHKGKKA